jgi:hypothetical protein
MAPEGDVSVENLGHPHVVVGIDLDPGREGLGHHVALVDTTLHVGDARQWPDHLHPASTSR